MATRTNNGGSTGRNEEWRREGWRRGSAEYRDDRGLIRDQDERESRWSTRERGGETWDRDRDDDYRGRVVYDRDNDHRMRYDRQLDSGRFVQGSRGWDAFGREGGQRERGGYTGARTYDRGVRDYGVRDYSARDHGTRDFGVRDYEPREKQLWGHRGKGPRNFFRSDERIRELVCEVLAEDDRIDASRVDVEVRNGEVTLTGSVEDRRSKWAAEEAIEHLSGIKDVHNQLRVHPFHDNIDHLNSFLRGEMAAVETYRMALEKLDRGSTARNDLESCLRSHEDRVAFLRSEIRQLGGNPASSSGPWGLFVKLIEGGARAFGDKAAIAALEEGEDHGLKDYKEDIDKLDPECRHLVSSRLLPAQQETHARMSSLKHRFS